MSRSRRHTPIFGNTTTASEKKDKRLANRAWRRIVRVHIGAGHYDLLPLQREVSNVWDFGKDGKRWMVLGPRFMRK